MKSNFLAAVLGILVLLGGYEIAEDGGVRLGQLATTMMACPDMETETAFLEALRRAGSSELREGQLIFTDEAGVTLLRLQARALDE